MTLWRSCSLWCPLLYLLLSLLRYSEMNEMNRWHAKCIQDRKVAAEIAEARAELKAKLETALLMHRLCHPKGKS
jgi:hypothetical protein